MPCENPAAAVRVLRVNVMTGGGDFEVMGANPHFEPC